MFNWQDYYEEIDTYELAAELDMTSEEMDEELNAIDAVNSDEYTFICFVVCKDEFYEYFGPEYDYLYLVTTRYGEEFLATIKPDRSYFDVLPELTEIADDIYEED